MLEIECTINTSVSHAAHQSIFRDKFSPFFHPIIHSSKKKVHQQPVWVESPLALFWKFCYSQPAKPSLLWLVLFFQVACWLGHCIDSCQYHWAAAALNCSCRQKSFCSGYPQQPGARVIPILSQKSVVFRFSHREAFKKMCYFLCTATIRMKLWSVWSFLKSAKSAAGTYVVGRRASSHGPAFLCPLICDLSIFSPTLLQGLVALPALF